jgi:myxalamid-type polyketide synthase MxaE and MxaD
LADDCVPVHAPLHASLWGAARVLAHEHPDWWGGLIDLGMDPGHTDIAVLARHLTAGSDEDQVAIRTGERFALRLAPPATAPPSAVPWQPGASYLITGGLGGIALHVAMTMVREGARRLVLLGRTPLPPRAHWASEPDTTPAGRRVAAIRALEHAGATVHLISADVADERQLRAALDQYRHEGWPPIRGVIHAAGILDSHLARDIDRPAFDRVMAPKLGAALALDRLLPDLDLFVVFSSMMAFWAPPGLVNYAAANAGLDALAEMRRRRGRHALSIQWGPWAGTGLWDGAVAARHLADLERFGIGTIAPTQGTAILSALLTRPEPVLAVVPIDWTLFTAAQHRREWPLFRNVAARADDLPRAPHGDAMARLATAAPATRLAAIELIVREALGSVIRRAPSQLDFRRSFGSMGLDSLMSLELRNRLETACVRALPATLAWNYPTIEQLVAHLDGLLAPNGIRDAIPPVLDSEIGDALAPLRLDVTALSEEDAVRVLRGQS